MYLHVHASSHLHVHTCIYMYIHASTCTCMYLHVHVLICRGAYISTPMFEVMFLISLLRCAHVQQLFVLLCSLVFYFISISFSIAYGGGGEREVWYCYY